MFFQGCGSLGYECNGTRTYDPKAGIEFAPESPRTVANEAGVEIPHGCKDNALLVIAHWTLGFRHATVTYTYRYVMPAEK